MLTPRFDLTDIEQDMLDTCDEATTISTGLTSDEGATELRIVYTTLATLVSPCGEDENGDDWAYEGTIDEKVILAEYLESMKDD